MGEIFLSSIFGIGSKLIDKLFPDPAEKARAQLELLQMQQSGELEAVRVQLSAIVAEAQSADPWTSRARPSFMYVFYFIVLVLVVFAPFVGVFFPARMEQFYINVAAGFRAIPDAMWATFSVGYIGYVGARQYGKTKGTDK